MLFRSNSKLRNEYYLYDRYVEQESAKGRALSSIFEELKTKGFSGSLSPFYDHYKYLSTGIEVTGPRSGSKTRRIGRRSTDLPDGDKEIIGTNLIL